jgi:quercetin dioxygenase-like cupin family protein
MSDDESARYFTVEERPEAHELLPGRYVELETDVDLLEYVEGLTFRPVLGDRVLVNFVHFEPDTLAPVHTHEEEQFTIVIDGEFEFDLDGDVRMLRRGQVAVVPPHVPHGARTLDSTCFEIDVFSPPRKMLLKAVRAAGEATPPATSEG